MTKVQQSDLVPAVVEGNVLWLDVSMDHTFRVAVSQDGGELLGVDLYLRLIKGGGGGGGGGGERERGGGSKGRNEAI
jgi:hypothetical protein